MSNRREFLQATGGALALGPAGLLAESAAPVAKPIPGTDENLPAIGLGTNRYAVGDEEQNAQLLDTLRRFRELGGTVIDTAPVYRSSETILGELIARLGDRENLFLATKSDRDRAAGGVERVENSFQQLRTETLDLVQVHNLRGLDMLPVLRELKSAGRIRYLGITTSRAAQFPDFIRVMQREPLDFIQVNYSLADREAETRILPLAQERGMAVLANVPLGRGRLFSAVDGLELPAWAADFGALSWAQFFLKFVIGHPAVTCAIPGMRQPSHVADNLGALLGPLPTAAQRARQAAWFKDL
jgi:aryl-alcohol dehydrogenase-like predicted oxidoreductase